MSHDAEAVASKLALEFLAAQYEKIRLLRQTDKSEVWLASDQTGKLVILKLLNRNGLPYLRLKELNLPIYPQIYYVAEAAEKTFLVEEYIQGDTLVERLRSRCYLSESEVCGLILQLCRGLTALHKAGIIHRDIKPDNLIIQEINGTLSVRLIDFDAARTVKEDSPTDTMLLGTKGYAPPEQYGYGQTDARSDIYSLGVTFLEALEPEYRGWLRNVLTTCAEIDPKRRYASVQTLARDIRWHKFLPRVNFILAGALITAAIVFLGGEHGKETSSLSGKPNAERQEAAVPSTKGKRVEELPMEPPASQPRREGIPSAEMPDEPKGRESYTAQDKVPTPHENSRQRNRIHAFYYFNGERLDGWTDNLDTPIVSAGTLLDIPFKSWRSWNGRYPTTWNVTVRIENQSPTVWKNPYLIAIHEEAGKVQKKVLRSEDLAPGATVKLVLPLSEFAIYGSASNKSRCTLTLSVHGEGGQKIFGPQTKLDFHIKP